MFLFIEIRAAGKTWIPKYKWDEDKWHKYRKLSSYVGKMYP